MFPSFQKLCNHADIVMPAQAGIQGWAETAWIPAFAGMTPPDKQSVFS
jgi:hypothetical protein